MLKMAEKLIENIKRGQEVDSKQYIADLAYNYSFWDDVPKAEKRQAYIHMAREEDELGESLFNHDDKFDCHATNLLMDILEHDRMTDWVKVRDALFVNLEEYYFESAVNEFSLAKERIS